MPRGKIQTPTDTSTNLLLVCRLVGARPFRRRIRQTRSHWILVVLARGSEQEGDLRKSSIAGRGYWKVGKGAVEPNPSRRKLVFSCKSRRFNIRRTGADGRV